MKLADLVAKPTLTKLTLDDEAIVAEYGEPLDFYTLLPIPMDIFLKFQLRETMDLASTITVLKDVILDEQGNRVLVDGVQFKDVTVLLKAITKLTEEMGKSQGKS
jgi:hypothetical protein